MHRVRGVRIVHAPAEPGAIEPELVQQIVQQRFRHAARARLCAARVGEVVAHMAVDLLEPVVGQVLRDLAVDLVPVLELVLLARVVRVDIDRRTE